MIGAIAGDIVGSVYERDPIKHKDFPLFDARSDFTDDSVLTVAVAEAILTDTPYVECIRRFGRRYPDAGYGASFAHWLQHDHAGPYNSWGNGSAMRVSAVGFAFDVSCQGSVPEALIAFLDSHDYEDAVRNAVSLGGDADTQACIAGAVAEAFYGGVPEAIWAQAQARLTPDLLDVTRRFCAVYR